MKPDLTSEEIEWFEKIKQDLESNPITKAPLFEEPKQYDIGFIPTISELDTAFLQMPSDWPGDTYTHELKVITHIQNKSIEKFLGKLTFTKLDGQWVYFGPTKYK